MVLFVFIIPLHLPLLLLDFRILFPALVFFQLLTIKRIFIRKVYQFNIVEQILLYIELIHR